MNNADLEIDDGEITGYNQYNQAVSAGYSSETKLTITVNVRFVNNTNHEQDFEQQFSAPTVFMIQGVADSRSGRTDCGNDQRDYRSNI